MNCFEFLNSKTFGGLTTCQPASSKQNDFSEQPYAQPVLP